MQNRGSKSAEVVLIFAVLLVHAGLQVPSVNETNYLAKARHYWEPQWCAGDVFLESADPHAVFYWLCGWWTLWLPLPAVAIAGRMLTYLALAWSWRRLSSAVVPVAWWSVLSAALMVTFTSRCHMAGEWIVGGFEAKGLAYALVFLGMEAMVRGRWLRVWPLMGLTTALHVLVGGWSILAAAVVWIASRHDADRAPLRAMLPSLCLGALISLGGLIPTARLDYGTDASKIMRAAEIQVFDRLGHHLNPIHFVFRDGAPRDFAWRFAALTVVCFGLWWIQPLDANKRRLVRFVLAAVAIAVVGLAIFGLGFGLFGARGPTAWLMRLYWFRLADAMVPVGAALAIVGYLAHLRGDCPNSEVVPRTPDPGTPPTAGLPTAVLSPPVLSPPVFSPPRPILALAGLTLALCVVGVPLAWETYERMAVGIPGGDRRLAPTPARYEDWLAVCHAVTELTPQGALFITPSGSQTFKWYAERPEVATWKEMPQDAESIVRWWDRMVKIHGPPSQWQSLGSLTGDQLLALGRAYNARYLLGPNDPRIDLYCVYRNKTFAIYEFTRRL